MTRSWVEKEEKGWSQTTSRMETQKKIMDNVIHTAGMTRNIQSIDKYFCAS